MVVRWEGEDWRVGVWRDTTVGQLKVLLEALHEPRLLRPNAQLLVLVDDGSTTTPHAELEDHAPLRQYGLLLEPTATTSAVPFLRAAAEEDRSTPFVRLSVRDDAPDYPLFPMPWLCELTEPLLPESRTRIAHQFKQLLQLQHTSRFGTDQFAPSASGLTLCEVDTTTYRRFTFFIKPQPGSVYACSKIAVRVHLARQHPAEPLRLQVLTPIHHPLVAPDGRVALYDQENNCFRTLSMPHVVGVLQMFREQLLVLDYSHLREACSEAPELQRAIDAWTADPAGQASKARAIAKLLAQPGPVVIDEMMTSPSSPWVKKLMGFFPECQREVRTLLMMAARDAETGDAKHSASRLCDLPRELIVALVLDLIRLHVAQLRGDDCQRLRSSVVVAASGLGYPDLPPDWQDRILRAFPARRLAYRYPGPLKDW